MTTTVISDADLDEYLLAPDCPQCGSEDVELRESRPDGHGGTVKVWYCRKCGHTWAEVV